MSIAALLGNVRLLNWLNSFPFKVSSKSAQYCNAAARGGSIETLVWFRKRKHPWDKHTCAAAAEGGSEGHLEILHYLRKVGPYSYYRHKGPPCPWDELTCIKAAEGGHVHVLEFLRKMECPWDGVKCSEAAARKGQLKTLIWLKKLDPLGPWTTSTCSSAAWEGQLEILKWLRSEGCPWDAWTTWAAARAGDLPCLQFARENGCPWDARTFTAGVEGGSTDCLEYLRKNGCPCEKFTCIAAARRQGSKEVLTFVSSLPL